MRINIGARRRRPGRASERLKRTLHDKQSPDG
jgi:hypothetical protein